MGSSALITGSSGGIGKAVAMKLAQSYQTVFLHYYTNKAETEQLARELAQTTGASCLPVHADLSAHSGVDELISQTGTNIDALVLNSGISYFGLFQDMHEAEINKVMALNLTSPMLISQRLIPYMLSQQNGSIVAVTSVWGEYGSSCEAVYSAAKGGMNMFIKSMAKELGPNGIRFNAVSPGAVDTPMMKDFTESEVADIIESIPAGRLGLPEEVAEAVHFLISEKSSYINGHVLSVNGAWFT